LGATAAKRMTVPLLRYLAERLSKAGQMMLANRPFDL
jgi:hypothetical protein